MHLLFLTCTPGQAEAQVSLQGLEAFDDRSTACTPSMSTAASGNRKPPLFYGAMADIE